jgi:hypothetical protein
MPGKSRAVFGIYTSPEAAERAVAALIDAGFERTQVALLLPENDASRAYAHRKDSEAHGTQAPEGAAAGATAGGVICGTIGILAGVGALAIPGVGPLVGADPIMAGLAGLGFGSAVGGLVGALIGRGVPEPEARRFEGRVRNGATLISVHCDTPWEAKQARHVLKATWAEDIASTRERAA